MRAIKVFGVNYDGRHRRIVAATSMTAAAINMGIKAYHMREYGSETGDPEEVSLAMLEPGVVWEKGWRHGDKWERIG